MNEYNNRLRIRDGQQRKVPNGGKRIIFSYIEQAGAAVDSDACMQFLWDRETEFDLRSESRNDCGY